MAESTSLAARVTGIDGKLEKLSASVDKRFEQVDKRFEQVDQRFDAVLKEITAEGDRTRRHFDVVAEQMKYERNLAIDMATATSERLARLTATNAAEHVSFDTRLTELEKYHQ
jgi:hypothetical protein